MEDFPCEDFEPSTGDDGEYHDRRSPSRFSGFLTPSIEDRSDLRSSLPRLDLTKAFLGERLRRRELEMKTEDPAAVPIADSTTFRFLSFDLDLDLDLERRRESYSIIEGSLNFPPCESRL